MKVPTLAVLAFCLLPLSAAQAAVYGGLDLAVDSTDLKDSTSELYPESSIGPDMHLGYHGNSWAVELGYGTTHKALLETEIRYNRLTGDGLVYVPLGGFLNFLVTAGVSDTNFGASTFQHKSYQQDNIDKTTRVATTVLAGDEINWRGGAGFSFSFEIGRAHV